MSGEKSQSGRFVERATHYVNCDARNLCEVLRTSSNVQTALNTPNVPEIYLSSSFHDKGPSLCVAKVGVCGNPIPLIPISIPSPELHHVHAHSHVIPMGQMGNGKSHSRCRDPVRSYRL